MNLREGLGASWTSHVRLRLYLFLGAELPCVQLYNSRGGASNMRHLWGLLGPSDTVVINMQLEALPSALAGEVTQFSLTHVLVKNSLCVVKYRLVRVYHADLCIETENFALAAIRAPLRSSLV